MILSSSHVVMKMKYYVIFMEFVAVHFGEEE